MDDAAAAAALEQRLEQQHQVFGFFFDFHVAVAQDAEHAPAIDTVAGKQPVEIKRDHFFQRNEAHALFGVGQPDEAAQLRRHRDQGGKGLAVAPVGQRQSDGETQIGNEGKGMRRIDRQRRQHRKNLFGELGCREIRGRAASISAPVTTLTPSPRSSWSSPAQTRCWSAIRCARRLVYPGKLFGGAKAVGAGRADAGMDHAHQPGHPHHVEFVQVGRGDGQKAQPLEQGMAAVLRFLDHPAVEGQPGEFAIDETRRAGGIETGIVALILQDHDIGGGKRVIGGRAVRRVIGGLGLGGHGRSLGQIGKAVVTKTVNSGDYPGLDYGKPICYRWLRQAET